MKIEIPTRQLLEQLPKNLRYDLIASDDLPASFTFDAREVPKTRYDAFDEEFEPHRKKLTAIEWEMLRELYARAERIPYDRLHGFTKAHEDHTLSTYQRNNLVAVHMKSIRAKLASLGLPYAIETERGSRVRPGTYRLVSA